MLLNIAEKLEQFKRWTFDNGVIYVTGRDVYAMILGAVLSLIVCLIIFSFIEKEGDEE